MPSQDLQANSANDLSASSWRDYLELCKPRVVLLMLLCATVGMFLATDSLVAFDLLLFTNLGIALVAGSAASVNHIIDAQIDINMARTAQRPIAQGRVSVKSGILFSAVTGIAGMSILALLVNPLTAWLNLGSWIGYGIIYSAYLKRATPQNIVIGGLFGAAPPLFGWTAVTNQIDAGGVLLVMIIFTWTPPHFWALALDRKEEYAKVNIPMLPVTHGERVYQILHPRLHLAIGRCDSHSVYDWYERGFLSAERTGTRFRIYCLVNTTSFGPRWGGYQNVQVFNFLPDDAFYLPSH